jgi:hypothetical protein
VTQGASSFDRYNYLAVLISIILGLGITQLLTGLGRLVHARRRVVFYAPTIAWIAILLLLHVQMWWAMFGLRYHEDWRFIEFVLVLMQPSLLYLMSALMLPSFPDAGTIDLRANYFEQSRWYYGLVLLTLIVSVVKDVVIDGRLPEPANLGAHVVFFVLGVIAFMTKRPKFHAWLVPLNVLMFSSYILLLFGRLR